MPKKKKKKKLVQLFFFLHGTFNNKSKGEQVAARWRVCVRDPAVAVSRPNETRRLEEMQSFYMQ